MEGFLAYDGERRRRLDERAAVSQAALRLRAHAHPGARRCRCRAHEAAAIVCFVVAPARRRQGVARALLDVRRSTNFAARASRSSTRFRGTSAPTTPRRPTSITARCRCSPPRGSTTIATHENVTVVRKTAAVSVMASEARATARCCRTRSRVLYGLAIVFASLQPFSPWIAPEPTRRSGRSRRGRCVGRASTSSPTSLPTCRSASSSRCRRGARRRARARRSRSPCGLTLSFAHGDAADVPAAARREPRRPRGQRARVRCSAAWPARRSCARERARDALSAARHRIVPARQARRLRARAARAVAGRADQSRHPAVRRDLRRRRVLQGARRDVAAPDTALRCIEAARIGVPAAGRRAVPRAAAARAALRRRRRAAAAIGAALVAKGARGDAHAEARGVGDVAQAGRVDRHGRGTRWCCCSIVFLPRPGAGRDLRDRAARVAAAPGARGVRPAVARARRSRCSTGATATCSTSTASRNPCCSCGRSPRPRGCFAARRTPALGRAASDARALRYNWRIARIAVA